MAFAPSYLCVAMVAIEIDPGKYIEVLGRIRLANRRHLFIHAADKHKMLVVTLHSIFNGANKHLIIISSVLTLTDEAK